MKNIRYQQDAVSELVEKTLSLLSYQGNRHILVFKSPTGSGKTVMAAEMLRYLNNELSENPMRLAVKWLIYGLHPTDCTNRVTSR